MERILATEYICRLIDSEDADIMVFRPMIPLVRCRDCKKSAEENPNGCYCHSQKRYRDPDGFCDEGMGAE